MDATCLSPLRKVIVLLLAVLTLTACAGDDTATDRAPTPSAAYVEGEVLVGLRSGVIAQRASLRAELLPGGQELERIVIGGEPGGVHAVRASAATETTAPLEVLRLQLPAGMAVADAVAQLSTRSEVLYAEPNYLVHRAAEPFFAKQWGLQNSGQRLTGNKGTFTGTPGVDIGAVPAWTVNSGNGSVIVATIDTGIEYDHPDLAGNPGNIWNNLTDPIGDSNGDGFPGIAGVDDDGDGLIDEDALGRSRFLPDGVTQNPQWRKVNQFLADGVTLNPNWPANLPIDQYMINNDDEDDYNDDWHGWNFIANSNDPRDDDLDTNVFPAVPLGHGTHVAGIIGAVGDNNTGVSGINWHVQLMPLKFLDARGNGTLFNAAKAIDYAVRKGARVINASYEYSGAADSTELTAIAAAGTAGVLFVAAAGNGGSDLIGDNIDTTNKVYPAAHALDNIIAVAATDPNDGRASFSNYGVTSVDLGAPGVNIYSTVRLARTGLDHQPGYDYMSGTSMAAPMVSGAAALLWAQHPTLTAAQVRQLLFTTVDTTPALTGFVATGGRLNLGRAMTVAVNLLAPAAPAGLTVEGQRTGALLTWVDAANNETGFIVERSLSGQPFVMVARLDANVTTYLDSTVKAGMVASYRVKAVAGINASAYSAAVEVTLPFTLDPPTNLTAFADSSGVHLSWTDTSSVDTGFKVERRAETAETFSEIATLPLNSPTGYTDTDVAAGGRYLYRVRAFSTTLGDSAYSNEILAQMAGGGSSSGSSRKCFIATAAYGTPLAPQVEILRTFRDRLLLTNAPGRLFVALYYRTSPPLANFIAGHDLLRAGVRTLLRPLVWLATLVTPNEAEAMGLRRAPPPALSEDADVVAGELLVCFRPELSAEAIATILRSEKSERLEEISSPQGTLLRIKLAAGVTTSAAQKNFSAYQEVVYAEPNRRVGIRRP
jgi:subtilisin family serine protease